MSTKWKKFKKKNRTTDDGQTRGAGRFSSTHTTERHRHARTHTDAKREWLGGATRPRRYRGEQTNVKRARATLLALVSVGCCCCCCRRRRPAESRNTRVLRRRRASPPPPPPSPAPAAAAGRVSPRRDRKTRVPRHLTVVPPRYSLMFCCRCFRLFTAPPTTS